jgi:superfamily II helicase
VSAVEGKAQSLSPNPTLIYKRLLGMRKICRFCLEEVDEEVWATSHSTKDGSLVFICDTCGKDVRETTCSELLDEDNKI